MSSYGGFVSLFAGDAFCALFPDAQGESIITAVNSIREVFAEKTSFQSCAGTFDLKVRMTVCHGNIHWQIYENPIQNEYVFHGSTMQELAYLSGLKEAVIFSDSAAAHSGKEHFQKLNTGYSLLPNQTSAPENLLAYSYSATTKARFLNPRFSNIFPDNEIRSAAFCFANLEGVEQAQRADAISSIEALADSYGGYVNKLDATDKGLLAIILFGLPRTEGDTLERICRFSLDAVSDIPLLALGHPVNLSARLMGKAQPGAILSDHNLYNALHNSFAFEPLGTVLLKGVNHPIRYYRLQEQHSEKHTFNEHAFVGRDAELAQIRAALDAGSGNAIVYILGDAGVGKSRLVREILDFYPDDCFDKFSLYCEAVLQKPLEPIKQLLRNYFGCNPANTQEQSIAAFRTTWKSLAGSDAELLRSESLLASLLGLEWEGSVWSLLPASARPEQLRNAFVRFIDVIATAKPIIIHLDDGQWLDSMSREYLQAVSDTLDAPVHILTPCRYLEDGNKPDLALGRHCRLDIELNSLDEAGSVELIRSLLNVETLASETYKVINDRAMGNPFYIEQFVAYLLENDKLSSTGELRGGLDSDAPFSIVDIIGSRIDRLTDSVRNCVANASILGMEFNLQVLSRMLEQSLGAELESGSGNRIWLELDELRYIFSHILIRDVIYQRMLSDKLQRLHQLAAQAMEKVYASSLTDRAEEIALHFEKAKLLQKAGDYYGYAGCFYRDAYNLEWADLCLRKALDLREQTLSAEHADTAQSLNDLASLRNKQEQYEQAEALHLKALEIREKVLGTEHPDTAQSLVNFASFLIHQGKYEQAEPYCRRGMDIIEKVLGADDPSLAMALDNLATLYDALGRYDEAESLYRKALSIQQKALGADHPDTATIITNLATLLYSQANYDQAESLFRSALAIWEHVCGKEHPHVALTLGNLANLYNILGRYVEAETLQLRALEIKEKVLGAAHSDTALSLNNLGNTYYYQGKYEQAEPFYSRALAIYEQALGPNHPDTAMSLCNVANACFAQGRSDEAEPLLLRALDIQEKTNGADHPNTMITLYNLAGAYRELGKLAQAEQAFLRADVFFRSRFGPLHPYTNATTASLVHLYELTGNEEKASEYRVLLPAGQEPNSE